MFLLKYLFAVVLIFAIAAADCEARDYKVRKKKGFTVDIAINRNPPVLGDNTIRIKIKDPAGKFVTGAP